MGAEHEEDAPVMAVTLTVVNQQRVTALRPPAPRILLLPRHR